MTTSHYRNFSDLAELESYMLLEGMVRYEFPKDSGPVVVIVETLNVDMRDPARSWVKVSGDTGSKRLNLVQNFSRFYRTQE